MIALERLQALGCVVLHTDEDDLAAAWCCDAICIGAKTIRLANPMKAQLLLDCALGAFLQALLNFTNADRKTTRLISVFLYTEAGKEM